jgi:hypothetical protein
MKTVPTIVVSSWLGAMAFFAFLIAPAAFASLERDAAARFVSVVFPRYYLVGGALGLLALVSCVARALARGWRGGDWISLALVSLMLALTIYAGAVVLPAAHAARETMRGQDAGSPAALRFARLHRVSAALNSTVMIAGIVFLVKEVASRP